jgi:hypothetical protein
MFSLPAAAQQAAPAPATPPTTTAAPPTEAAPAAPAAPAAAEPSTEADKPRFRWGISPFGGPLLYSGNSGGAGGIDVRFGVQWNKLLGFYAQPALLLGGGVSASSTGGSASAVALGGVGFLADVTLIDLFYLAAGPEILGGGSGAESASTTGVSAGAASGAFFSINARAGIALGSMKPDRRQAFILGLDFRSIFVPGGAAVMPGIALGYESF